MRTAEVDAAIEELPEGIASFDESGIPSATTKLANDAKLRSFNTALRSDPSTAAEAILKVFMLSAHVRAVIAAADRFRPLWKLFLSILSSTPTASAINKGLTNVFNEAQKSAP